jgi:hypothetical protein
VVKCEREAHGSNSEVKVLTLAMNTCRVCLSFASNFQALNDSLFSGVILRPSRVSAILLDFKPIIERAFDNCLGA